MSPRILRRVVLTIAALAIAGCATTMERNDRAAVEHLVSERSGRTIEIDGVEEGVGRERLRALLVKPLTVDVAVEIALLQNRELRALYTDLDVADSDVLQATLLHNPVIDGALGIPIGGGIVDFSFSAALDVIDLLYVPLRKRVAGDRLEETKLRVAGGVLDFAWRTQTAFYRHQAEQQRLELRRQVAESAGAAAELSRRLRKAGNITELASAASRAFAEEARLDVRSAEIALSESREQLNVRMGLWGDDAGAWSVASGRLADPPAEAPDVNRLESRAIERSLDLAAAERLVKAAVTTARLDGVSALFPEVVAGARGERDGGDYQTGPTFALPIPLFDHGQARIARATAELRRSRELHHALAVEIRAMTRSARDRLVGHRDRALHYKKVLLPLEERVVRETELHYNAMQIGPLDLLRAKEKQIETASRYVESLRDYWIASADLGLLLAGRMLPREAAPSPPALEQLPRFPFPTLQ